MIKVTLVNHTPEPEKMAAIAARMCYTPLEASEMVEKLDDETVGKMIMHGIESHHESLFEHITFSFIVEGISRVCSHQLVRHRIATYHQRSQRYVKSKISEESVIPPSIKNNPTAMKEFVKVLREIDSACEKLSILGIPKDDIRFLYPNATETQLMVTMNIRSLIHFLSLRCCKRASWEIQEVANQILKLCREVSPLIFNHVGPNCYLNHKVCPEGKMACGKLAEVCDSYLPQNFNKGE